MKSSMDLHVESIMRMRGGVVYKNKPAYINSMGLVQIKSYLNDKVFILEEGSYVVTFKEVTPHEIEDVSYAVTYSLNQYDLMLMGACLTINLQPFKGFLTVSYPIYIEPGSRLGTFSWVDVSDEEEIILEGVQ
jgi:hypothetical protein